MGAGTDRSTVTLVGLEVTDHGLSFAVPEGARGTDFVVDVLFDGRRVWSFWVVRDTEEQGSAGRRSTAWPAALGRFLDGSTTLSLVDHVSGAEVASVDATLGSGTGRIAVVDKGGRPLGLDKSLVLSRLFDSRDPEQLAPLLDSAETVLAALREAGVEPFLAYGSLLGAVREGGLIGHDSDADLGYVSRHSEPVDAVIESFRLQRRLVDKGYWVVRYSGMAFRVNVREADGALRGLDVFAGILRDGHLYLMGEVGAPFEPEWIRPLSEVSLEGRVYPAPARPERLLEAMYGPHWRTPDPAFKFETSEATRRRLDGWFRGTRGGRALRWEKSDAASLRSGLAPSAFLKWVRRQERAQQHRTAGYVDLGCGAGTDTFVTARQGVPSWGLDFRPSHFKVVAKRAARRELPATYRWTNFNELRSVLPTGAELARSPGPRLVTARHLVDALDDSGRELLLRFASMVTREDGRFYLQVLRATEAELETGPDTGPQTGEDNLTPMDVDALIAQIERGGGRVVVRQDLVERPAGSRHVDTSRRAGTKEVTRLGVTWER
jgi:hypothetical protein